MDTGEVHVGIAGWSYPDWEGVVYPKGASRDQAGLRLMAGLFDVIEINVTFYRPLSPATARKWLAAIEPHERFRFTAKLWQGFTHRREEEHANAEKEYKAGIAPLSEAGRLGAVLAQFPHSFKNTPEERRYLAALLKRFAGLPLVVELRHDSWMVDEVLEMLSSAGAGFCNLDQPLLGHAVPPSTVITSPPGYVRLHGRNRKDWFREDAGRDARYDYLYAPEEIDQWADRIRLMTRRAAGAPIYIIANNHYRGQAAANALELKGTLSGAPVPVPDLLLKAFPRLSRVAAPKKRLPGGQAPLPL